MSKKIQYKYNEDQLIKDLKDYVDNTYGEHYAQNKVQTTEFVIDGIHTGQHHQVHPALWQEGRQEPCLLAQGATLRIDCVIRPRPPRRREVIAFCVGSFMMLPVILGGVTFYYSVKATQ